MKEIKSKSRNLIATLLILAGTIFVMVPDTSPKAALTEAHINFYNSGQANDVISNEYFVDVNSMTVNEIQSFLDANNSYLKDYVDDSEFGMGRSAAQVIWDAAHGKYQAGGSYNGITINESTGTVNPKLILVYLQKEQSLISRTSHNDWAMLASLGYFCYTNFGRDNPSKDLDGNNCHDSYQGFTRQVENGAWQLRYNYERAQGTGFSDYQVGQDFTTSDDFVVNFSTRATASVYRYTPYVYFSAYNVWNLFYNIYDFDQGGGVPAPQEPPSENDTTHVSSTSYAESYSYTGYKTPDALAYIGEAQIGEISSYIWSFSFVPQLGLNDITVVFKRADGSEINRKTFLVERHKIADIDGNGTIDITDLAILAENWGVTKPDNPLVDIDGNNVVDITDFAILAENWGG